MMFLTTQVKAQAVDEDEDDSGGLGMAEAIAIVVCILIILAFVLACVIMLRNAAKKKRMAAEQQKYDLEMAQHEQNKS